MPGPTPGVWFRKSDGWWYSCIKGKQRRLVEGKKSKTAAQEMLRELLGKPQATANSHRTVADILDAYLDHLEGPSGGVSADRLKYVQNACKSFVDHAGAIVVSKLLPAHAKEWLAQNPRWSNSTQAQMVATIRAGFNWGMRDDVRLVSQQPLGKFHGPRYERRGFLASEGDVAKLLKHPNPAYRDFVTALVNTGARPSEVSRVEARDVDLERGCWVMARHKNVKKKPSARVIWLNAEMAKLTKRLMKANPDGPLFRSSHGAPWNATSVKTAFRVMRKQLGVDSRLSAYSLRHEFVTRALARGEDIATVSAMCGTGIDVLHKHYAHLLQKPDHMRAAVERVAKKRGRTR